MFISDPGKERRSKRRFIIEREVRFRILEKDRVTESGVGQTLDISSSGVAFENTTPPRLRVHLAPGTTLELSISWPVLLDETCLMKLVVFGHVVRTRRQVVVCTIDRYEFRTQARPWSGPTLAPRPGDGMMRRWMGDFVRETKASAGA
jgi:hypothetical protein